MCVCVCECECECARPSWHCSTHIGASYSTSPPFCCWSLHVRVLHARGPSTRRSCGLTHKHAPPAQSLGTLHALLFAHRLAQSMPPQSTSVSFRSRLQLEHDRHASQGPPHATQLTPPSAQLRHVSPASSTLFLHVAGIGREAFRALTKPLQRHGTTTSSR